MTEQEKLDLFAEAKKRTDTIKVLLTMATTGKALVKGTIGNHVSLVRITSCLGTLQLASSLIEVAVKSLATLSEGEYKNASKNLFTEIFRAVDDLIEVAKLNYAYFQELLENPDRSYEELKDAASKREIII